MRYEYRMRTVCAIIALLVSHVAVNAQTLALRTYRTLPQTVRVSLFTLFPREHVSLSSHTPISPVYERPSFHAQPPKAGETQPAYHVTFSAQGDRVLVEGKEVRLTSKRALFLKDAVYTLAPDTTDAYRRRYRGIVAVIATNGRIRITLHTRLEDYLASVVYCERVPESRKRSAQRALAICARSYTLYHLTRRPDRVFPDDTSFQVFKGLDYTDAHSVDATERTEGRVIVTERGEPFLAFYASTHGDHTRVPDTSWVSPEYAAYYSSVENRFEGRPLALRSPHYRWRCTLTVDEVARVFREEGFSANAKDVTITYQSGYIHTLVGAHASLSGWAFRMALGRAFGWSTMKSTYARVTRKDDAWVIAGKGLGHGIGLCVYGADELSRMGFPADDILRFYFRKIR